MSNIPITIINKEGGQCLHVKNTEINKGEHNTFVVKIHLTNKRELIFVFEGGSHHGQLLNKADWHYPVMIMTGKNNQILGSQYASNNTLVKL
jgi:hypothetical protein